MKEPSFREIQRDTGRAAPRRVSLGWMIVGAFLCVALSPTARADRGLTLQSAMAKLRQYSRMPASISPSQMERCATSYYAKVWEERQSLSRGEQEEMKSYFLRPGVDGGHFSTSVPLNLRYDTGHFRIFYTTRGPDAVPMEDVTPRNGVPDYIDFLADACERSFEFEVRVMGFKHPLSDYWSPDNGGDERWDVYVFNAWFLGVTVTEWFDRVLPTGVTASFYFGINGRMYDYFGKAEGKRYLETTMAHEFLHSCQYAYNAKLPAWVAESSATWMESRAYDGGLVNDGDHYDDPDDPGETNGVDQIYQQIRQWYLKPDVSLDTSGGHAYGNVIFMNYLTERFGYDFVRELYEEFTEGGGREFGNFWDLLATKGTNWVETFKTFTIWNYFTAERAGLFNGYRSADRYPPVGIHPNDVFRNYPVSVLYDERQMPESMSVRYVQFEPPAGGFNGTFSVKIRGANVDELIAAGGFLDFSNGKPDKTFYLRWLEIIGLRGWAAPVIIEKMDGSVVLDEIFLYLLSQEGQKDFAGFGTDIKRITVLLTNIRPDAEERGNYISFAAGAKPRGVLTNLTATAAETGGVRLNWQLQDLTDLREVYVVRKRYSPTNSDFENAPFASAAEVLHAGDRNRNSIPDSAVNIIARLPATDTTYFDATTFQDVNTTSQSFDPAAVRYYYAAVPVGENGIMGAPAIAPAGVNPIPPAAPAFLVATKDVRVGMWDISVHSTLPLADAPSMTITLPDGETATLTLHSIAGDVFEGRFYHPHFPKAGIYRYSLEGVTSEGKVGSWVIAGGTYRYAPSTLKPSVQIIPNRIHRAGDGMLEFYPRGLSIRVYSLTGEFIRELSLDSKWDRTNSRGESVAKGVYIYVAEDGNGFRETGRLVLK